MYVLPMARAPAVCRLGNECVHDETGGMQETAGVGSCTSKTTARDNEIQEIGKWRLLYDFVHEFSYALRCHRKLGREWLYSRI